MYFVAIIFFIQVFFFRNVGKQAFSNNTSDFSNFRCNYLQSKNYKLQEAQLAPNATWESELLESAKSSLIFELVEREKSIDDVVLQNFISNCFYRTNRIADINRINIQVFLIFINEKNNKIF